MENSPAEIVEKQVDAYNRGDVEGFTACYSDDVTVFDQTTGRVLASGMVELRRLYRNVIEKSPGLHCSVAGRLLLDRFVLDREILTGLPDGHEIHAVAIYEVVEGRIRRVWMIRESAFFD
ncbi:MAG: nuclear transport factor 2 family protein [Planctomycetota bacterium]|jgi:hypothetical protein